MIKDLMSQALPDLYTGQIDSDLWYRLWHDMYRVHDHDSVNGRGAQVSHVNLLDTDYISGTYLTHAMYSKHVQGSGTGSNPDATGGNRGVHGLAAAVYVFGVGSRQYCIQVGTGTTNRVNSLYEQRGRGTFARAYTETPVIWVQLTAGCQGGQPPPEGDSHAAHGAAQAALSTVYQKLMTSFAVKLRFSSVSAYMDGRQHSMPFNWMALGISEVPD